MIERLRLTNFQKHEKLDLRLDPAITVIVGPTDAGKSSIIRALRWLSLNRPLGDGFIMDGCGGAEVRAKIDGRTVVRAKGKAGNGYAIDEKEFEAFGTDVPPEVKALVNVSEVNFQGQHDSPYWFSLSPADVARQLNRIVDLDEIDEVASDVAKEIRDLKFAQILVSEREAKARAALAELNYVPLARKALDDLLGKKREAEELAGQSTVLAGRIREVKQAANRVTSLGPVIGDGKKAVAAGAVVMSAERSASDLLDVVKELRECSGRVMKGRPNLSKLELLKKSVDNGYNKVELLRDLVQRARAQDAVVGRSKKDLTEAKTVFDKELGDRCPLCGASL